MDETVRYTDLRPAEFEDRLVDAPIAYLPLGTLEWHGEHLPYGTDGIISGRFFDRLAARIGGIVLPMLHLGPDMAETVDGETFYGMDVFGFRGEDPQQLPGSAYWADDELFGRILTQTLSQLERAGFDVVVAHGHGPSTNFVEDHREELTESLDLELLTCRPDGAGDDESEGLQVDHAAANETSLMQALAPELVAVGELPEAEWPVGVDGEDPREAASAERGSAVIEEKLDGMASKLAAVLDENRNESS